MRITAIIIAWGVAMAITIIQATMFTSIGAFWTLGLAGVQAILIALFFLGLADEPRSVTALLAMAVSAVSAFVIAVLI